MKNVSYSELDHLDVLALDAYGHVAVLVSHAHAFHDVFAHTHTDNNTTTKRIASERIDTIDEVRIDTTTVRLHDPTDVREGTRATAVNITIETKRPVASKDRPGTNSIAEGARETGPLEDNKAEGDRVTTR